MNLPTRQRGAGRCLSAAYLHVFRIVNPYVSMKKKGLFLSAAMLLLAAACRRDTNTATPQFYELSNASVAQIQQVGQSDFVAVGSQFDQNNQNTVYLVRYNLQNGIVWEENLNHSAGMITGHRLAVHDNNVYVLANDGTNNAVVHRCDLSTGSSQGSADFANSEGTDLRTDSDGNVFVAGTTSDVNTNKPAYDPTTDLSDLFLTRLDGSTLASVWHSVYGFQHLETGGDIGFGANDVRLVGTTEINNGSGGIASNAMVIKFTKNSSGITNSATTATQDIYLSSADADGDNVALLSHDVAGNLRATTLDAADNSLTETATADLSTLLPAGQAVSTHQHGSGYIVVSNSLTHPRVTSFDSAWGLDWQVALDGNAIGSQAASTIRIAAGKSCIANIGGTDYCVVPLNLLNNNTTTAAFVLINLSTGAVTRL